jgi:hypothetical protein
MNCSGFLLSFLLDVFIQNLCLELEAVDLPKFTCCDDLSMFVVAFFVFFFKQASFHKHSEGVAREHVVNHKI